jgi:hypothetical protein
MMNRHKKPLLGLALWLGAALALGAIAFAQEKPASSDPLSKARAEQQARQARQAAPEDAHGTGFWIPENMRRVKLPEGALRPNLNSALALNPSTASGTVSWLDPNGDGSTADGILTPVKDQGATNLCWLFADTANLESRVASDEGRSPLSPLVDYSEQDMGNFRARPFDEGGWMAMAASYYSLYGPVLESDELWKRKLDRWHPDLLRQKNVSEWWYLGDLSGHQTRSGDPDVNDDRNIANIQTALTWGPVSVSISSGLANAWDENWGDKVIPGSLRSDAFDHAVVIVGWNDRVPHTGTEGTTIGVTGAWLVRNSWSSLWGGADEVPGFDLPGGYAWVGYGAINIGFAASLYPVGGYVSRGSPDMPVETLHADQGWRGAVTEGGGVLETEAGEHMLVKYTVPDLPDISAHELYAVEVTAASANLTYEIRIYQDFDGNAPIGEYTAARTTGRLDFAGIYTVDLNSPVPVEPGQTVVIRLKLTQEPDFGGVGIIPVSDPSPLLGVLPSVGAGKINELVKHGKYMYLAGTGLHKVDVSDPQNPTVVNEISTLDEECIRLAPVGDRLIAGLYKRSQGDYSELNTAPNLDATSAEVQSDLPFFVYDTYNATNWRKVDFKLPKFEDISSYPGLNGYADRKRMIYSDPCMVSSGNALYVLANRYQDRWDRASDRWRFWWDFALIGWDFTDPYNPTPLTDTVFDLTGLSAGYVQRHHQWYYDYDATGAFNFGVDGKLYGPGYSLDTSLASAVAQLYLDKLPDSWYWDKDGDGTPETLIVASVVNSLDADPHDRQAVYFPGDPGDILLVDYSQNPPARLSRIGAGDSSEITQIPFPAEDISVVDNILFVADAQGGLVPIDVSDPRNPVVGSEHQTPNAIRVEAWRHTDGLIYVYLLDSGGEGEQAQESLRAFLYSEAQARLSAFEKYPLSEMCYYSDDGVDGNWLSLYDKHGLTLVLRGKIRVDRDGIAPQGAVPALIAHYYNAILGRNPEAGAVIAWEVGYFNYAKSFDIDPRFATREMARLFFLSEEYAMRNRTDAQFIADCYQTFLERAPTSDELNAWLAGSWNRAQVMTTFAESDEAARLFDSVVPGFQGDPIRNMATTMYVGILDRLVDKGGLDYWAARFYQATDRRQLAKDMASDLFNSEEYRNRPPAASYTRTQDQVVRLYRAFMSRFPSDSELAWWTGILGAGGGAALESAINGFGDSPEFTEKLEQYFGG